MAEVTDDMTAAQGDVVPGAPTERQFATRLAAQVEGASPVSALENLALARATDCNADSAFGVKFCDVTDALDLDFEAAAVYFEGRFGDAISDHLAFAVAVAATGLHGMAVERAIIEHFDFLAPGERSWESDGRDCEAAAAFGSIKRNDRSRRRHGSKQGWGDEETILISWGIVDGEIHVAFEDHTRNVMGHKVVRGLA